MATERSLQALSAKVYELDFKHKNYNPLKIGEIKEFGGKVRKSIEIQTEKINEL